MTYNEWRRLSSKLNSSSPEELCEELLRWHSAAKRGINFETDYTTNNYKEFKEIYLYYLNHIRNPFIFNKMYNKFLKLLEENIKIKDIEVEIESNKVKPKPKNKPKVKNQYYKVETRDIFGNVTYNYINPKTGDSFFSDNPNLLEELNKKKVTKVVSLDNMTFSFKKKL